MPGTVPQYSHLIPTEVLWGVSSYHSHFTNRPRGSNWQKEVKSKGGAESLGESPALDTPASRSHEKRSMEKVIMPEIMHSLCDDVWEGVGKDQCVEMICCLEEVNFFTEAGRVKAVHSVGSWIGLILRKKRRDVSLVNVHGDLHKTPAWRVRDSLASSM